MSETCRRLLEGPPAGAAVPHLGAPRAAGMRPQRRGGDGRNVSHRWIGALCRRSAQVPAARVWRPVPRLLRLALQGPELALQPRPGAAERRPRDGRDRPRVAEALIRSSPWQDLPNYAQHVVPIHSLPEEWLWCGARRRGAPKAVSSVSSRRPECTGARRGAATPPSRAPRPSTSATTRSPRSPSSSKRGASAASGGDEWTRSCRRRSREGARAAQRKSSDEGFCALFLVSPTQSVVSLSTHPLVVGSGLAQSSLSLVGTHGISFHAFRFPGRYPRVWMFRVGYTVIGGFV